MLEHHAPHSCATHPLAARRLPALTLRRTPTPTPALPQVRIEHNGDWPGSRYLLENDAILVTLFDGCARLRSRRSRCPGAPGEGQAHGAGCAAVLPRRPAPYPARPTVYAAPNPTLPTPLLNLKPPLLPACSYDDPEIALQCGLMFRDCIRHEVVARLVLESHIFTDM